MLAAEQDFFGGVSSRPARKKNAQHTAGPGALGSIASVMGSGQWVYTTLCTSLSTVVSKLVVRGV